MYHLIYFLQQPGQEMCEANETAKNSDASMAAELTKTERRVLGALAIVVSVGLVVWAVGVLS